jgi:hypothetical protein
MSADDQNEDEPKIVRILGDPTSRKQERVHVAPDTTVPTPADADIEVVPILPGSAYDRGGPVSSFDV